LYKAYHHIELLEPAPPATPPRCDVVGPICESADFLGQDRLLGEPREGDGVIVYDAGAYGFSMASRYNLHLLCAEYLIDKRTVRCIRRAETYDDFARTFSDEEIHLP
jgi:diaminopimelate decarboxylase